jgi:hypothetical protein
MLALLALIWGKSPGISKFYFLNLENWVMKTGLQTPVREVGGEKSMDWPMVSSSAVLDTQQISEVDVLLLLMSTIITKLGLKKLAVKLRN